MLTAIAAWCAESVWGPLAEAATVRLRRFLGPYAFGGAWLLAAFGAGFAAMVLFTLWFLIFVVGPAV